MNFSLPDENLFLDLSDRTKLRLTGEDRLRFLNGQVSNDVRRATERAAIYTGVMTIKGKLCGDAFVRTEGDAILLDAPPELRESLPLRLERYLIADDVQLEDVSAAFGLFHLLDFYDHPARDAGAPPILPEALAAVGAGVRGVAATRFGRPGLDVFFEAALADAVRAAMPQARYTELNDDALLSLRILLGVPAWGAELDENVLPAEAGIEDRAVSFSKGCYIGQEVVSRVRSVGHVNRVLRGLRAEDASPLYPGMQLYAAGDAGGKAVGRITSAAAGGGHGGAAFVALGYVRRELAAAGTELAAVAPPGDPSQAAEGGSLGEAAPPPCRVQVCGLPFV